MGTMNTVETILIGIAFALVAALWFTLYPRPRLQMTERGLFDRNLRLGWICWDEIEGAYTPSTNDDGLRLRLRPGENLLRRLRRNRDANVGDDGTCELRLDLSRTDLSSVELLQEVLSRSAGNTADDV
jgi:hypothetical protein